MKTFTTKIALSVLMLLPITARAQYENQQYLPLTTAEISNKFPVTYIGTLGHNRPGYFEDISDKQLPTNLNIGPSGATVETTSDDSLMIRGKDKLGKDWSVQPATSVLDYACRFYVADLDRNGMRDAMLVFPTGGNGLAPTNHILTISFDEQGRPVTFEADGYFEEANGKIFDLVDLNRNGRAELIYMNFSDGYWITNIYEIRNARWRRIVGRHGNRNYPVYTRFTIRENHKPTVPKPGRHPFARDLSNDSPRVVGTLVSYKLPATYSDDISLTIKDRHGKVVVSKPMLWYASFALVLDSAAGRKIVSFSAEEQTVKSLLDLIIAKRYEISLFGRGSRDGSSPDILWARAQ